MEYERIETAMELLDPDSDERILHRISGGELHLFSTIFRRHSARSFACAFSYVRNVEDAQDIVSSTFEKLWCKVDEARTIEGCVWPWISVTIYYLALNLRRSKRRQLSILARMPSQDLVTDGAFDVEHRLISAEISGEICEILSALGRNDRDVVFLCLVQERTIADAARILGIPEGTVKSRLSRSRSRLRQMLGHLS